MKNILAITMVIIGAIIGANIATKTDVSILKKCFAIFLLFIAIFQIYEMIKENRNRKKTHNNSSKQN